MVASLNQSTPARDTGYEGIQYICTTLTMGGVANLPVVKVGTIPAGAIVVAIYARISTAFAGGTPVLGVSAVTAGGAVPAVGATSNVFQPITNTLGASTSNVPSATVIEPLAADTDFYVGTSGGATAGVAVVAIAFIKPLA
jgi:hypothetical protein